MPAHCLETVPLHRLHQMAVLWQSTTDRQIEWKVTGSPTFRNLHRLTALAVHPALTIVLTTPQVGYFKQFGQIPFII